MKTFITYYASWKHFCGLPAFFIGFGFVVMIICIIFA